MAIGKYARQALIADLGCLNFSPRLNIPLNKKNALQGILKPFEGKFHISFGEHYHKMQYKVTNDIDESQRNMFVIDKSALEKIAETNEIAKFILEYTNLNDALWDISKRNPGTRFYFSIDYEKYAKDFGYDFNPHIEKE